MKCPGKEIIFKKEVLIVTIEVPEGLEGFFFFFWVMEIYSITGLLQSLHSIEMYCELLNHTFTMSEFYGI